MFVMDFRDVISVSRKSRSI